MKRKLISLLLVLVLILSMAPIASAETGTSTFFSFFVVQEIPDSDEHIGIENAVVVIYADDVEIFRCNTSTIGRILFTEGLPSGTTTLRITVDFPVGYTLQRVTYSFFAGGGSVSLMSDGTFIITNLSGFFIDFGITWRVAPDAGTPPPPDRFTDVPPTAWFHDAVAFVYDEGIMRGASPTTFDPMADFHREQVVATLFRMYHGRPANASDPTATPFADVDPGRWYAPYIAWAFEQGIVTGQTATTFGTGDPVTRQDFAVLVHRFASFTGADTSVPDDFILQFIDQFPDADTTGSWAQDALAWAFHTGLITGTGEGVVLPWGSAIRAEAATILMRYVQRIA